MFYNLIKPLVFKLDAEKTHELALKWLKIAHRTGLIRCFLKPCDLPCKAMGLEFKNPVGLAAGFDKNGDYLEALCSLGFGFIELGTVTPRPQDGNPVPRLFRLCEHRALINRMGFNNKGVDYLVSKISDASFSAVIGVNVGKNLTTHIDDAHHDYLYCLNKAYGVADYFAVNISSPNTPDLRKLQLKDYLERLLSLIGAERDRLFQKFHKYVPVVVKIAPDLGDDQLRSFVRIFKRSSLDGIIATNTTLSRKGVESSRHALEPGGLSGEPLSKRSAWTLKALRDLAGEKMVLIASGGIMSGEEAAERIRTGASLVQLYTGLVYSGPALVGEALRKIKETKLKMEKSRRPDSSVTY